MWNKINKVEQKSARNFLFDEFLSSLEGWKIEHYQIHQNDQYYSIS